MSKLISELKGLKSVLLFAPFTYYLLVILSILMADEPKTIFYYNEMIMLPLIVMMAGLLFQREFSGSMMEIYATFPVSLIAMLLRKVLFLVVIIFTLHLGWTFIYLAKFDMMETTVFAYSGAKPAFKSTSILHLFFQAFPGYLFISSIVASGLIFSKQLYGGWLLGFAVWMFFSLMGNEWNGPFSLYTIYIREDTAFWLNQLLLLLFACGLTIISAIQLNKRTRWIVLEEE
ncbi:hypothetical protein DCC39_12130 [Pueribacillus theae]|uniref:Uncharacterized protein n=1 Tax=Pueribacillus theae TaxID=2171751 RepID=A0A2U1JYK4_9BACI|nr:hypothetical protein [Pueribacillus theae]PWA10029.1 hypothetical protein DCC39_12130 [Pueribacillus theae]